MSTDSAHFEPAAPCHPPVDGQPAWDIALLFPPQGQWTEAEYLSLTEETNWRVEYSAGVIEVQDFPTIPHQRIVKELLMALHSFVAERKLGTVLFAPTRVRIDPQKFREPDVSLSLPARQVRGEQHYLHGVDLVMEVVDADPESHRRDWEQKRIDYAQGAVTEYWVVDPQQQKIVVFALQGDQYAEHGVFVPGESATSKLLPGFAVNVTEVFAAAKPDA